MPTKNEKRRIDVKSRAPMMIATLVVGLVLSLLAFRYGRQAEETRIQASFERAASERIVAVEARLLSTIGSLHSLASFFETEGEVSPEKFRRFVSPLLSAYAGVQAFEWAPFVTGDQRAAVEDFHARELPGFAIREKESDGAMKPAGVRAKYVPVALAEPMKGNEKAFGFDLLSNPARRAAIEAAIETRAPQGTARITLVQEQGDQFGFLVFFPVFDQGDRLRGLVLGVFRIGDVVTRSGAYRLDDADLTLTIADLAAGPKEAQLFPSVVPHRARPSEGIVAARTLQVGGRPWKVEARATQAFLARERGAGPWTLLAACLFLTANIAWLIDRRYAVEEEVLQRTAEMRRARDEARAASRAKSDFLATMSHEIRTPLNGVIAMADHLLENKLPPDQREPLEVIARSSEHLLAVINNILDYSKLEARKLEFETRDFRLEDVLRDAMNFVSCQAADKGLALDLRLDPALPPRVSGDSARLRQILLNLLSNAIKFTEHGQVSLEVVSAPGPDAETPLIAFAVRDTGVGMTPETIAQLFTEFHQADNSISRRFGGTGLGLAISRRIATQLGGDIEVASAPGVGSAFTLKAPMRCVEEGSAVAQAAPVAQKTQAPALDGDFSGKAILLVEDNPTNCQIARTILARMGASIDEAHDGLQAIAAASNRLYDLILMDVHMPNMNGLDATRAIRALPPPWNLTPIVALSASAFAEDQAQCREAGMNDFLAKPYRGGPLRDIVARAFGDSPPMPSPKTVSSPANAEIADEPAFVFENYAVLGAEMGEQDARELLVDFMTDAHVRLETMRTHLEDDRLVRLSEEAHALKSSAAMMGLARLSAVSLALEHAAARADRDAAQNLNQAARTAFDDARPFVDEVLLAA